MFGLHKGRHGCASALILASLMLVTSGDEARTQSWSLEREQGVGGAGDTARSASNHVAPKGKDSMVIIISDDQPPVIKAAGDAIDPLAAIDGRRAGDEDATVENANAPAIVAAGAADLLSIKRDVLMAQQGLRPAEANEAAEVRLLPPTAADLLGRGAETRSETTVAALPSASAYVAAPAEEVARGMVEQAQLVPNAVAAPETILPPRAADRDERQTETTPTFLPSPPKPGGSEPVIQQVVLTPNVGRSPKTAALRAGPVPDNKLVELVETPSDQVLELSAGRGQLINLGTAVSDIFVADPNIADVRVVSPTTLFVHGNQLGRTNIFGMGADGNVVFGVNLEVVPDAAIAQARLRALSPDGNTNIELVSDQLVAEGAVNDVEEAIQVAALSDQLAATEGPTANNTVISSSQQVNLRVRFAEVSRDDVVNLGVDWSALGNTGDFLIGLSTGPDIGDIGGLANDLVNGAPGSGDINVEAFIDALHQEGIISLLAEPNLTVINGETGNFLAGSEIPIPVPGADGTTNIEYKEVGVSLDFIPTLLPGNRINLRIRPEVSTPSPTGGVIINGIAVPAFSVRRTETSVELASGQTMALAGLFQRDVSTDINKFPLLGDLPYLGQLFRSERYQRSETELVILITPYMVQPTNNPNIALPHERIDASNKPLAKRTNKRRAGFIVN